MNDELDIRVLNWLDKQGYPFELRVGAVFRKAGWHVDHAVLFTDPETGKTRELDIIATLRVDADNSDFISFKLAAECKTSRDKPWVGFSAPRQPIPPILQYVLALDAMSQQALQLAVENDVPLPHLLQFGDRIAHGVIKAFADSGPGDPTAPYAAVRSAMTAAQELGQKYMEWELSWQRGTVHVMVPLIIVDAVLYDYTLDTAGHGAVHRKAEMLVDAALRADDVSFLRIITIEILEQRLPGWTDEIREFCRALLPYKGEIIDRVRSAAVDES